MQRLTKKTTVHFSSAMYRQLERVAKEKKTSVAHLVRMELPVSDWPQMEREIAKGRAGHSA